MIRVALLLSLLVLAGCQTTARPNSASAPMPDPASIMAPGQDVPSGYAAFSGIWTGSWGGELDGKLAVQEIRPDGSVSTYYTWGDDRGGAFLAGAVNVDGQIEGDTLVLKTFGNGANVSYEMTADGKLRGEYRRGDSLSKGVFTKL